MSMNLSGGVTLSALARAYGGEAYAGGRRAVVPAPGHSAADRSASLWLRDGRVIVKSFGGADWREVLDDLRERGWIDAENRLLDGSGAPGSPAVDRPVEVSRTERVAAAARLWAGASAIEAGSVAARHLARRGVDVAVADTDALRTLAAAPAAVYRDAGPYRPALLAAVRTAAGDLTAVEITYLDAAGRRSGLARPPRKVVGVMPPGCAVRLCDVFDDMVVGEGVFTTLSAMRRFGRPGWALLSTSNLRRWRAPAGVRRVLIAADRGTDGERSAGKLWCNLQAAGVEVRIALPPEGIGDWNDLDQEG